MIWGSWVFVRLQQRSGSNVKKMTSVKLGYSVIQLSEGQIRTRPYGKLTIRGAIMRNTHATKVKCIVARIKSDLWAATK
jgi:hypothetical protein